MSFCRFCKTAQGEQTKLAIILILRSDRVSKHSKGENEVRRAVLFRALELCQKSIFVA